MQGTSDFTGSVTSLYSSLLQTVLLRDSVGNIRPNGLFNSGYSSNTSLQNPVLHQVNYYDSYKFMTLEGFHTGMFPAATQAANGLLTGTVTALLDGSGKKLYTVYYYDEKGRQSRVVSSNHLGGYDTTTMTYTFTGKPATMKHVHAATGTTELYTYTYDSGDRLKSVTHKLDSHAAVTIVNNTYDNLGRLQKNSRNGHGKLATTYCYNVRNWMTKVTGTLFSESLTYGYGGNIATVQWTTNGNEKRKYAYTYDGLSRLTYAAYSTENISGTPMHGAFYNYDKHGNIQSLYRYGLMAGGYYGQPDYLKMTYDGNRLTHVKDESFTAPAEQSNDFRQGSTASTHYFYDKNGRLVKDLNKNITDISYNSLHLPGSITVNGATHTYVYAADGRKLRVVEGGVTRDYVGNLIYENGSLKRILFDGGYIEGGVYHFYLTDYLGNVSTVADATGNLVQQNRYYPFGLPTAETGNSEQDKQPYKYNGKELDRTNGLNWYDYGARMYDPALCRFLTMDPLAEKYYGISPYAYCGNNPVRFVDPDGCKIVDPQGNEITYQNGQWSSNATESVKIVGNAMMRNDVGKSQFQAMIAADFPITINVLSHDSNNMGRLGVTRITKGERQSEHGTESYIAKAAITLYSDAIQDMSNIVKCATKGEIVERYQNNLNEEQLSELSYEDVLGATATHESVHAIDSMSNLVGEPDKTRRENNPVEKEIAYIRSLNRRLIK